MFKRLGLFLTLSALFLYSALPANAVLPNIFATQPAGNVAASLLDTNFTFLEKQGVQGLATSGSSNAYVATPADAWVTGYSSYVGRALTVIPNFTNTAGSTVNVSGLGAASIYKNISGVATVLAAGDISSANPAILICDGTNFLLATPSSPNPTNSSGGGVNKFRNAAMDVWQRGPGAFTIADSTPTYSADGWIVTGTGASITAQRVGGADIPGTAYVLRATGAASVTDITVKQRIESVVAAPLAGNNVTVQIKYFNASAGGSVTPTLTVKHANVADNWGATTTDVNAVSLQPISVNASGTLSYSFTASASSGNGLEVTWDFGNNFSSNSKYLEISQADIRVTPNVTPAALNSAPPIPEIRPIALELPFDQRYLFCVGDIAGPIGTGWSSSTTASGYYIPFPVAMFLAPTAIANTTVVDYSVFTFAGASVAALSSLSFSRASGNGANVTTAVASGLTTTTAYQLEVVTPLAGNSCFTGAEL